MIIMQNNYSQKLFQEIRLLAFFVVELVTAAPLLLNPYFSVFNQATATTNQNEENLFKFKDSHFTMMTLLIGETLVNTKCKAADQLGL